MDNLSKDDKINFLEILYLSLKSQFKNNKIKS